MSTNQPRRNRSPRVSATRRFTGLGMEVTVHRDGGLIRRIEIAPTGSNLASPPGEAREIDELLLGEDHPVHPEALSERTSFEREVLGEVRKVPAGTTLSYSEVARRIGRDGAQRAVGGALRKNPLPLLIPCHRVVTASGKPGGYLGSHTELKQRLLDWERQATAQTAG